MSSDERVQAEPRAGAFSGCLMEGNVEENARERNIKRRAIGISIVLQSAGLAALVIAPLFAKPAELTERIAVPIPPYRNAPPRRSGETPPTGPPTRVCLICPSTHISPRVPTRSDSPISESERNAIDDIGPIGPANTSDLINNTDSRPQPPHGEVVPHKKPRIHEPHIDRALLVWRVEPVFPPIPRQLRKSGKVELHAIIATDGSIQSLEVVSGDPLFINSAREAVAQWRYKPTYLNGQPVEIDTFITVIYTLQ